MKNVICNYSFSSSILILLACSSQCNSFTLKPLFPSFGTRPTLLATTVSESLSSTDTLEPASAALHEKIDNEEMGRMCISTPLKYIGPYACMGLRFPELATSSQRERNVTGVSLDFMIDTAANINVINAQVAQELQLPIVGQAPGGVGSSGEMMDGTNIFSLGDTQMETLLPSKQDDYKDDNPLFMQGLTASALPVASPASAGILSYAFLSCFEGGVEFNWGGNNTEASVPSLVFYGQNNEDEEDACVMKNMIKIDISRTPVTLLPTIKTVINGVEIQALLDTGSPITVLNKAAAGIAGIETYQKAPEEKAKSSNPLASVANFFREGKEQTMAAQRGELVMIPGLDGKPVCLYRSKEAVRIGCVSRNGDNMQFESSPIFVGDIPGLAALNGLGDDSPPAMILGLDVLRSLPRMLLRAQNDEVYFEN